MDANDNALRAEELLSGSRWIRGIARSLISDPAAADDLVQDSWVVALSQELPARDESGSQRPWLARVVRNLAGKHWRTSARRAHREAACAQREAIASTAELVARAEMQRLVVEAVLALSEPYRTAILFAYVEGLTSVDIARSLRVSERTVRWRIQRGVSLLRFELERRRGGEWLGACALLSAADHAATFSASKIGGAGHMAALMPKVAAMTLASLTISVGAAVALRVATPPESASAPLLQSIASTSPGGHDIDPDGDVRRADTEAPELVGALGDPSGIQAVAPTGTLGTRGGVEFRLDGPESAPGDEALTVDGAYLVLDVGSAMAAQEPCRGSLGGRMGTGAPIAFRMSPLDPNEFAAEAPLELIGLPVVAVR